MEKTNIVTKKVQKKQAKFENKGAPIAQVRQEKCGVSASCNVEIVEQQLK